MLRPARPPRRFNGPKRKGVRRSQRFKLRFKPLRPGRRSTPTSLAASAPAPSRSCTCRYQLVEVARARATAGGRAGGRKVVAERRGLFDPANAATVAAGKLKGLDKGRMAGGLAPKPGCTMGRTGAGGRFMPGRRSWPPGTELFQCPECKAWGAYGKVHNLIMGQAGYVKGGPYKRCGRASPARGSGLRAPRAG
jgi:hypothetical protein